MKYTKLKNSMKTMMTTRSQKSTLAKAMMLLMIFTASLFSADCMAQQKKTTTKGKTTDKNAKTDAATMAPVTPSKESEMRKLWSDQIVWTRQYMISEMSATADKDAIFGRLRQNTKEMAKAMKDLYPGIDEATLATMLDSTVITMTTLIFQTNIGSGNNGGSDAYSTKEALMKHLDKMAVFLNTANPGWSLPQLKLMLQGYLNETHNEIMARKNKIWDADIAAYDRLNNHVMKLADAFATGTIQLEGQQQQDPNMNGKSKTTGTGTNKTGTK
jgi:hypothetical protein